MNILLLGPGERCIPPTDVRARHIKKVLRAGIGDTLVAGEIDGAIGQARIQDWTTEGVTVEFTPEYEPAPPAAVDMVLGHPRPIVLRRMLRDLCSIGVRSLLVVPTELGEKSYYQSNMWEDIRPPLLDGASQAGTTRLMTVQRCESLAVALQALPAPGKNRIVLHPGSDGGAQLLTHSTVVSGPPPPVCLTVGSERGWTPNELATLADAGFSPYDLGPHTLRTESAATVAGWIAVQAARTLSEETS